MDKKNINDLEYKKFTLDEDWNIAINAVVEWTWWGTFKWLKDTPNSYTWQSWKVVAVNSTEDAVEFVDGWDVTQALRYNRFTL